MTFAEHAAAYRARLERALSVLADPALAALAQALDDARERGATVYVLGNGGSAANAAHLANDLAQGLGARGMNAWALADSTPAVTAAANDHGYAEVFVAGLRPRLAAGDLVLILSASGDSENLVRAARFAREHGATVASVTGFTGGRVAELSAIHVHVPSDVGDYGPPEDLQLIIDHVVTSWLRGPAPP